MTTTDTKLTEAERELIRLYRSLDTKHQGQVLKAAKALKVSAEHVSKYSF